MTPTEVVDAFISAIERQDIEGAVSLLAPEVSYENMPMAPLVGPEAVKQTLEMFLAPATKVLWPVLRQVEVGDMVFNERLDRFKIGEGWLELPIAGVFEVHNGKITLWRDYFDMDTYSTQMAELTNNDPCDTS